MGDYNLDNLGWAQFERLVQSLLKVRSVSVESWSGSGDGGRDAYSASALNFPDEKVEINGPFVFQAKFISGANAAGADPKAGLRKAVRAEICRIDERVEEDTWRDPNCYVLFTNAPVSPALRTELHTLLNIAMPSCSIISIQDSTDISAMLDSVPAIRMSFPQILGLRDLTSLLRNTVNADVIQRSASSIAIAADLAPAFVATAAYTRAVKLLDVHGFCVLTGPPEMGKTAIARMIGLARHTMGWEVFELTEPGQFFQMLDRERKQLFIADDAFGSTEFNPILADAWAREMERVLQPLDSTHHLIWTSRPAPLNAALKSVSMPGRARKYPDPGKVEVDASALSVEEKAFILYRHAKNADLAPEERTLIKRIAREVVSSPHFTPLRVKLLVEDRLKELLRIASNANGIELAKFVASIVREPTAPLRTSFAALSSQQRDLLFALLSCNSPSVDITELEAPFRALQGELINVDIRSIANELDLHFVRIDRATAEG